MAKRLSMKNRLRLTAAEARAILNAAPVATGLLDSGLKKIAAALRIADHECDFRHRTFPAYPGSKKKRERSVDRFCVVCGKREGSAPRSVPEGFKAQWKTAPNVAGAPS